MAYHGKAQIILKLPARLFCRQLKIVFLKKMFLILISR
jgi:hypothetical protein